MYYAGIGSRQTPEAILQVFEQIGEGFAQKGLTLRSGRADGADSYFETGARRAGGDCEIFLPWASFQKNSPLGAYPGIVFSSLSKEQTQAAINSVRHFHPCPQNLSQGALKLMARNYCQLFGTSPDSEASAFVVCYTNDGKASGGTGQAIRMAEAADIPVLNAHGCSPEDFYARVMDFAASL